MAGEDGTGRVEEGRGSGWEGSVALRRVERRWCHPGNVFSFRVSKAKYLMLDEQIIYQRDNN